MKKFCKVFEIPGDMLFLVAVDIVTADDDQSNPRAVVVSTLQSEQGFIKTFKVLAEPDLHSAISKAIDAVDNYTQEQAEDEVRDLMLRILANVDDTEIELPPGTLLVPGGTA